MFDFGNFELVFGPTLEPFPYKRALIQEAEANRRTFEGALFIDRVLAALGHAKTAKNYPPKNVDSLRQLHSQITGSTSIANHHKLSVLYYLLLDINATRANEIADSAGLPSKYRILMQGLWYMDRQQFPLALQELCHPSLLPEFADDIITILVRQAKDDDYTLALAYWHTVQPVLKTSTAVELLFEALVNSDVAEALQFSRARPEAMRELLFQRLITTVLEEGSADRACELAALPLHQEEETWFEEYLTSGNGKRLKAAKDTLLMRRIATGAMMTSGAEKGTWGVVMEAFRAGSGGRV